ncbi:metalloprotease [Nocardioides sp. LML1-1-1.1]|uniref:metalloprotease n=1 Tax=Nocardioides sp. LML1-1-1.1 TaxID=3135248 RepID=UPI003422F469
MNRALLPALAAGAVLLAGCSSAPERPDASGPDEQACVTGTLQYTWDSAEDGDEDGGPVPTTAPVRAADWELWAADDSGEPVVTGITDDQGSFDACVDGDLPAGASLHFPASSRGLWQVVDDVGGSVHTFSVDVTGDDLGTVAVPRRDAGAWKIVDTAGELYAERGTDSPCWTAREKTAADCSTLSFVWAADRKDGGYFDVGDSNSPILAGEDAASRHTIVHEAGHWWQWLLYDGRFPRVTDCTPHFIDKVTSRSCAWTEGFADAVAAYVLGDDVYVHDDGLVQSFASTRDLPVAAGDAVEGNVAASLLDLWQLADGWDDDLAVMTGEPSGDFEEYVTEDRPAAGLPVDADVRRLLGGHTIDY